MNFRRLVAALATCAALPAFAPALAETPAADPAADLAAITAKAAADRNLQVWLQQMLQYKSRPNEARMMLDQQMFQFDGMGRTPGDVPFNYRTLAQVLVAQQRAQYLGQILTADLNNDGQITMQEIKDALRVRQIQGAAEAFFSSDANNDSVLAPEEIRAAADRQVSLQQGRAQRGNPAQLFDFDDDGIMTPAEHDRGMAALGL